MTTDKKKLNATEMWFLRGMLKIRWTDKISNAEVRETAGKQRWIKKTISKQPTIFFGHVMKIAKLKHLVTTGTRIGKISKGRQQGKVTNESQELTEYSSSSAAFALASDRGSLSLTSFVVALQRRSLEPVSTA